MNIGERIGRFLAKRMKRRINRYSYILTYSHINGQLPEGVSLREILRLEEMDAIGELTKALLAQHAQQQGATGVIALSALAPGGLDND
jgi:hypothetical protein